MRAVLSVQSAVVLLLELTVFAAIAWWAFRMAWWRGALVLAVLGALWWLFLAPSPQVALPLPWRLLLKAVLYAAAVLVMVAMGWPTSAAVAGGVLLLLLVAEVVWPREATGR